MTHLYQTRSMKLAKDLVAGDVLYDRSRYGMLVQDRTIVTRIDFDGPDLLLIYCDDKRSPVEYLPVHPLDLVAVETDLPAAIVAAIDDVLENGFRLDRRPIQVKRPAAVNPAPRQTVLFTGLNCSAGQADLFPE